MIIQSVSCNYCHEHLSITRSMCAELFKWWAFECSIGNTLFLGHVLCFSIPHENEHRLFFLTRLSKTFNRARRVHSTDMTDVHKVVNRQRSVNSIHLLYSMYTTCIHVAQRSTVLADTDICLTVKTQPASVGRKYMS